MSSSFIRESESTSAYLSKHIVTGLVVGGGKKNHVIQWLIFHAQTNILDVSPSIVSATVA
jgi:hypothetical protein